MKISNFSLGKVVSDMNVNICKQIGEESLPHRGKVSNMDEKISTGQKIEESYQFF